METAENTSYWELFVNSFINGGNELLNTITQPHWFNFFYALIGISAFFFLLEILAPWRKNQKKFRKDFWLDFFYMFFNMFIFYYLFYKAPSDVVVNLFDEGLSFINIKNFVALEVKSWPFWAHILIAFVLRDFVQWTIHVLLHRVPFLWNFHKVHHSVEQMGFAAHLRYHWMENIVYASLQYIPLALIGIGLRDFSIVYLFALFIGHYNHSNFIIPNWVKGATFGGTVALFISFFIFPIENLPLVLSIIFFSILIGALFLGKYMKYIFNGPAMHIWHHAKEMPKDKPNGVNFGLTLSIWDYLFKTNHTPHNGRDITLGFNNIDKFPKTFMGQLVQGFKKPKR